MKWTLELATLGGPIEVTDEDGRVVAYVNTGTRGVKDPKEAERIGRLVAAAPELYDRAIGTACQLHVVRGYSLSPALDLAREIFGEEEAQALQASVEATKAALKPPVVGRGDEEGAR